MSTSPEEPLSTTAARDSFAEVVNRAAYGKERVVLTRRGKPLVAVVPIEDVELLEGLEDELELGADPQAYRRVGGRRAAGQAAGGLHP